MALSRDVVIRLLGDASSAVAATKAAADAAEVSVAAYRKAEREQQRQQAAEKAALETRRQAIQEASQSAVILGGAMLAAFGIAAKAAMDFDKSMSAVGAATMANAEQMGQLRQAALDAGAATMFSATEAADAETELAKAGLNTADILGGALKGALDLAAAGQLDVASAAGIAATTLKQFQLSGSQTSHVADLLAAGAGKALGSVQDLSEGLKYVGPVAHGMGVSIEETTGALALFASKGILGEQAGTSLRGVISSLSSPSMEAQKELDKLGISVFDAQGKFKGLGGVAGELRGAMSGLTQEERSEALGRIFGNAQLTAAQVLYDAGSEGVKKWTDAVNDSGYAQEQAARLTDNLAGDIERLGGSISTVLIDGGSKATGVLRFLVQAATDGVNSIGTLPGPLQAVGMGLLGVVGGGTLLLGALGTIIPRIQEARAALEALGPAGVKANGALGMVGKAGGGAALALVGITLLSDAFDAMHPPTEIVTADATELTHRLEELGGSSATLSKALRETGLDELIDQLSMTENHTYDTITGLGDLGKAAGMTNLSFGIMEDAAQHANDGFKQAQQSIKDTDSALAGMVNGGSAEAAAKATMRLYDAWTKAGGTAQEFKEKFPDTVAAMEAYSATSQTVVSDTGEITTGLGEAASAADILKTALDTLNGAQINQVAANIAWTQTLADLKIAAADGSKSLDLNTKAGADNAAQFVDAAKKASDFSQAVADTKGLEAGRAALGGFRDALVEQAVKAGFSRDSVIGLIDTILQVPKDTPTAVTLHDQATPGIEAVNAWLDRVNGKTATTTVTNNVITVFKQLGQPYKETGSGGNPIGLPPVRAAGGPVWPGQPFLVGEKGPELVQFGASGFVTPHDMTKRAIAAGSGIPVGSGGASSTVGPAIDYDRLAAAVSAGSRGGVSIGTIVTQKNETGYELAQTLAFDGRTR
jgi:TP901 family phage tail tape measure protein